LSSLTNGTDSFNFTYDVNNVLTAISLPNGLNETYSYDDIYNLTNINTGYSVLDYAHDNTGLITSKTRDGASIAYTYDAIARLTQAGADSYNYEVTGMIAWKPVIELIRNYDKEILNLTLSNEAGVEEILGVTPEHPFWVEGKAWVNASNLVKGMLQQLMVERSKSSHKLKTQRSILHIILKLLTSILTLLESLVLGFIIPALLI